MQVTLNIGLNITGGDNTKAARRERAAHALRTLRAWDREGLFPPSFLNVSEYEGPDGTTQEETLVVLLDLNPTHLIDFRVAVLDLATDLGQDCIAWQPAGGEGELTGPRAEAWGEFNPGYFITFTAGYLRAAA